MKRSLFTQTVVRSTLPVTTRDSDGVVNGASVDRHERLSNARSVMLLVVTGTITDGTHVITFEHSDDEITWDQVPASFLQGTPPTLTSTDDNQIFQVGYSPQLRFVRAVVDVDVPALGNGGVYGAFVQLGSTRRGVVDHT